MLEVGYLHIDNPIAVISSHNQPDFNNAAGLLLLDGFDLDEAPLEEMQASLEKMGENAGKGTGAFGLSATCSRDEPLMEAARLASKNLCLLDLRLSKIRDPIRLLELIPRLKRCGVTLSLRIRPEDLSNALLEKLNESELDIIHLDLRGLNGAGPKMVKKAKDSRGPVIMALADIGEFEDARNLLAMGADVVSLRGADPEFARVALRGHAGVRLFERLVQCTQAHLRGRRPARPGLLLPSRQELPGPRRSEKGRHDSGGVCA